MADNKSEVRRWLWQMLADLEIASDAEGKRSEDGPTTTLIITIKH